MSELKPCPFCGCKAQRGFVFHKYGHKMYFIECSNKDCLIAPTTIAYKAKGADTRAWNRRADISKEFTTQKDDFSKEGGQ